ncbi:hypothetical protein PVAND_014230 [Polypedilum vanderplanki]|uniref:Uncharacterized protein n=1 Tax=Polypedilum vanderplanki TaxID=319348 RepID=A0A9J6CTK5_POLVA|nr:hypothetical protein PVAND_014230 [Polypedilum vanderplanki]
MKRYRRTIPKFKDFDEVIVSYEKTKKKRIKILNPCDNAIQNCSFSCETYVTTENPILVSSGVNHVEGGWPKDINRLDEEQTARYRKKQEKDEAYVTQMKKIIKSCSDAIYQNNAINLYENYFEDIEEIDLKEEYSSKTLNMYRDGTKRNVRKIQWNPDDGTKFTTSHSGNETYFDYLIDEENTMHIWDVDYPKSPIITLDNYAQSQCFEYNPKEHSILVTGMVTGQICVYDTRSNQKFPQLISVRETSHKDQVNSVTFYCSKTNMEFFSGSSAGEICWWDQRNLNEPIDVLLFEPETMKDGITKTEQKAFGILWNIALEYESTIPTKYMVGTDHGVVYICNKRFKTPADRIYSRVQCHAGFISAVQRNPSFLKFFLSVGDFQAKIWCEELKEQPIFWTKEYSSELTFGCWNSVRCSSFYLCRMDGVFDAWDVIHRSDRPVLSTKISDYTLLTCEPHKEGKLNLIGTSGGDIHLLEMSENLSTSTANDRPAMAVVLDRETRREKLLENKQRELKLKEKEKEREQIRIKLGLPDPEEVELNLANDLAKQAEVTFHLQIEQLKLHC